MTLSKATEALQARLDPGNHTLAVQDFRHAVQKGEGSVADFMRRLEHIFKTAYGRDGMPSETRSALLYAQMQEGLKHKLI